MTTLTAPTADVLAPTYQGPKQGRSATDAARSAFRALLLRDLMQLGVPPAKARLRMSPESLAEAWDDRFEHDDDFEEEDDWPGRDSWLDREVS